MLLGNTLRFRIYPDKKNCELNRDRPLRGRDQPKRGKCFDLIAQSIMFFFVQKLSNTPNYSDWFEQCRSEVLGHG